jgi:hypothetical protein
VKAVELLVVAVSALLGFRSLVHWARRPFDSRDPADHALFAAFVTGRAGLWLAVAGLFLLYASTDTQGRAFVDDVRQYQWFLIVFLVLAAIQFVAGFFLGRRSSR